MDEEDKPRNPFAKHFGRLKSSDDIYAAVVQKEGSQDATVSDQLRSLISAKPSPAVLSGGSIIVSDRQRGNPVLKSIRSVPWEYGDIIPDYVLGQRTCALYLSLRYHDMNPDYVHQRLKKLGQQYELRILLVEVDSKDPYHSLKELTSICVLADLTLMLSWSNEESGRILETYKAFENKPADLIMEKQEASSTSRIIDALTTIRSINRPDAMTLLSNFGSLASILKASKEELALCPGFGPSKAAKLHASLKQPFIKPAKTKSK